MERKMKKILNRETISYLIFGVLTTAINYAVFIMALNFFGEASSLLSNTIAFAVAVTFAYVTNKFFVFGSKNLAPKELQKEIVSFFGARLVSFGFEELVIFVCSDILLLYGYQFWGINMMKIIKALLNVFVVVANYFFSKFIVFKKK